MNSVKNNTYNNDSEKNTERVSLVVNSFCAIVMTIISIMHGWSTWLPQIFITTMVISWALHIKNYKDYNFRAYFTSGVVWLNFIIYSIQDDYFIGLLPVMCAFVVFLGVYCIPRIVYISIAASAFIVIYHVIIKVNIQIDTKIDVLKLSVELLAVFISGFVMIYLLKVQNNNRQKLIETIENLKKAEKSKDDFLANVSHEIRTPINTVCGMSEMILREDISEQVRNDVFDIQTAGRNLLAAVSDILDFSELESGNMDITEEPYNITSTINDIMNMSIARKNNKAVELIVECDANIPCGLVGDEQKIRRVIMNIVDNAIKFTNEGGVIIKVSSRKEQYGINLIINIKDTGIGMKEETIEKLFTSFNQVDTKRNRQEGGIGLGLAISQAIVSKMGGFITVKSKFENGSDVQIVIPQKVSDERAIVQVKDTRNLHVGFYIDMEKYDFASVREGYENSIQHMMEQLGISYRNCKNLQELKRRIEKERFTHIFISWDEYCEDQQYFEELSYQKKVILIRGRDNEEMASGQIYYIYKPFYVLSVASVLNGDAIMQSMDGSHISTGRFTAPNASVLVVDDNVMNLRVVEGLLKPYKIKVFVAGSGKEALQKIESMEFDFVFMDHMMPEMDGVETLHRIRQKPGHYFKTVPIIALTANAIGGAREMFLAEGFNDFVAKPIEVSVLERVLRKHIPENKIIKLDKEEISVTKEIKEENNEFSMEGINIEKGIMYAGGDLDDYIDIVRIYYTSGIAKKADIENAFSQNDWKNYAIMTHSLKSMSMSIGAEDLSEMAKGLETAGKAEDEPYIYMHHEETMTEYDRILSVIGANNTIFPKEQQMAEENEADETKDHTLSEMSKEELETELNMLKEQLDTFEFEGVQNALERFWGYQYNGIRLEELLSAVKEKIDAFDFMGASEELETVREKWGECE